MISCTDLRVERVRKRYADNPGLVEPLLEFHERSYLIIALLAALNWRLDKGPDDKLPNLVPEAAVISAKSGVIRFLDYLGLERDTDHPLLVVESKRRGSSLPNVVSPITTQSVTFPETIARGLKGEKLSELWPQWLDSLRDYVRSVTSKGNKPPRRVLLTDGCWLVAFIAPEEAFLADGSPDTKKILVVEKLGEVNEIRAGELFEQLEYYKVAQTLPPLAPGEVGFYVRPNDVVSMMHGLRIRYVSSSGAPQVPPTIWVKPVVHLRSTTDSWLRVEGSDPQYLDDVRRDFKDLKRHLEKVEAAASKLAAAVNAALGLQLKPVPLTSHYAREDSFQGLPGVRALGGDEFLICTGDKTHYLMPEPTVPKCPYHDWMRANKRGMATNPGPITVPSSDPRALFFTGQMHHCAHRDVEAAKSAAVTPQNEDRCGPRSAAGWRGAFCEIRGFESHLCCRTCVFEEVCTAAPVFTLPCKRA
jgi:hypothetical protein